MIGGRHGAPALVVALLAGAGIARGAGFGVPGTDARFEAAGWIDGLAVAEIGGPYQGPQALTELSLAGKLSRALRTQLTLRSRAGGPFEGGHPGIMNFVHEFQNRTPSLELNEAWAELRLGDAQLRAGVQKFAWGKLDGAPPTDVLTPRDLHDPFVRDFEESKIGIPAVQFVYFLPPVPALDLSELKTSIVYVPIAVPSRLALAQERWFPPTIGDTRELTLSKAQSEQLIFDITGAYVPLNGPTRIPINFNTLNARPPTGFDDGGIAVRLSGTTHEMDWSLSHYTGPETGPNAELVTSARCRDCLTNVAQGNLPIRARTYLRQAHDVIHMTGADWSAVLAGATVRAEVAVFQNRPYLRPAKDVVDAALEPQAVAKYGGRLASGKRTRVPTQQLFPDRDSVEWGIGADYLIGGFLPLLQLSQVVFTDSGPPELLSDPETRLLASVRKKFLQDTVELEMRGVYAFERAAWSVYPRATYRWGDNWRFRLGYLGIGGPLESMIGQFHKNDEFTFEARYSF